MMSSMRLVLPLLVLAAPALATAALPPELQAKVESLAKESDGLVKQRHKWEGVQQTLLAQKQQIEASQKDLGVLQDNLNQKSAAHNQAAAAQQQQLQSGGCKAKSDDSGVAGGDLATDQCNKNAKKLNASSAGLNTETTQIQSDQQKIDDQFAKINQTASDWNAHESAATEHLNDTYRLMNEWLDSAYAVISNSDFRDTVTETGSDAVCENRGLPTGTLSIPTLNKLSDAYRKCLKTVLSAQQKAALATPAP